MESLTQKFQNGIEVVKRYPKETKRKWGDWIFKDNLTLVHAGYKSYEIDLEKMSREQMLDWIYQLSGKGHVAPRDIGFFVYACKDIFERDSRYDGKPTDNFIIKKEYMKNFYNGKE